VFIEEVDMKNQKYLVISILILSISVLVLSTTLTVTLLSNTTILSNNTGKGDSTRTVSERMKIATLSDTISPVTDVSSTETVNTFEHSTEISTTIPLLNTEQPENVGTPSPNLVSDDTTVIVQPPHLSSPCWGEGWQGNRI
jgi:hypothetical protein